MKLRQAGAGLDLNLHLATLGTPCEGCPAGTPTTCTYLEIDDILMVEVAGLTLVGRTDADILAEGAHWVGVGLGCARHRRGAYAERGGGVGSARDGLRITNPRASKRSRKCHHPP